MTGLQSANLASMSDKEFFELVWEDGQLLMRGFPKRTPNNPSCIGHSSQSSGGDHLKNGGDSTFPPKSARFGAVDSILDDPRHDNKTDFYQNFTKNSSLLYDKYNESPPELYQRHFNEFSELDRGNSYDKLLKDSQVVPENEYANLKPGYASNHLSTLPEQFTLQKYLASAPLKRPRVSHNLASLGVLPGSKLHEQDLEPERKRETVNFSLFLRSPAMATRSRGFSRDEELKNNGKTSGPRNDKPFESASIAPDVTASKTVKGFQNQLNLVRNNADLLQPISKPPDKSLQDVQSEAVCRENGFKYKRSPDRQVYGQPSSLPANTVKGKPNTEKYIEPPVASSSFCSRGASNNPTYTLKRRYVETDGSACPSDENVEEKPANVKKALPARGSKGNRKRRFAEVHNLSERKRRDKINKKMSALQELIPNCSKVDKASMLDEAIEYLKSLQLQVQMMSMGTGVCMPPAMMLPTGMQQLHAPQMTHFSPMGHFGMGMRMQIGVGCVPPHFLIPPILGATAVPGLAETGIQMPVGFPGQTLPMSSMFPSPFGLMHKTIPIAGVSGPTPSTELMDSAPLTNSKDSIHNVQVNNNNVHRSKIQPSGLPLRND